MFSSRVPADLTPNRAHGRAEAIRERGEAILDLTASNPTRAGFDYPPDLLAPLADPRGLVYSPEPLGLLHARQAVVADFARRGRHVDAGRHRADRQHQRSVFAAVQTALRRRRRGADSSSELSAVRSPDAARRCDRRAVRSRIPRGLGHRSSRRSKRALTPRTRAVLVVSPNNPTGNFISPAELARLADLCAAATSRSFPTRCSPTIRSRRTPPSRRDASPTGTMCWASRLAACRSPSACRRPSWPGSRSAVLTPSVREARSRLELIVRHIFVGFDAAAGRARRSARARTGGSRADSVARITANHRALQSASRSVPACDLLQADGGWYAVLQGAIAHVRGRSRAVVALGGSRARASRILLRLSARVVSDRQPAAARGRISPRAPRAS